MESYKYKFTFFTPCYNAAPFIHRVFKTLDSQTYRNFEWIVINDASTDNTAELIREYIKKVDFPVKFFDLKKNQMLAANYNLAFENTEGELFFLHDHDDEFVPTVLEDLLRLYEQYDAEDVCGLVARCETQFGKVTPCEFTKPLMTYFEYGIDKNGNFTGEAPRVLKTKILKKYMPFEAKEMINPTIEKLMALDGYKFITTNQIIRKYYVSENETALTYSANKYRYHLWKDALLDINKCQPYMHWSVGRKFKGLLNYAYSSVQLKLSYRKALSYLECDKKKAALIYPLGWALSLIANNRTLHDLIIFLTTGKKRPVNQ